MKIGTDGTLLGAWANCDNPSTIVDLGAGSGLLALMMAQRCPVAEITALEIDPDACQAARDNFSASPWAARLHAQCADATTINLSGIDLIVCNPPYFTSSLHSPNAKRAAARHASALSPMSALKLAAQWLSPLGSIAMVTPADLESDLVYNAALVQLSPQRICRVSTVAGKPPIRMLSQWQRNSVPTEYTTLEIRTQSNAYTTDYCQLTRHFYLKL